jgi:hypothetical protein
MGQKLTRLVTINIAARMNNIIATVPEIMWAKYNTAMTTAISTLITLSIVPKFFFIVFDFSKTIILIQFL